MSSKPLFTSDRCLTRLLFALELIVVIVLALTLPLDAFGQGRATARDKAHGGAADTPMPGDYRIVDGRVDRGTYSGWRIFHTTCYSCHGVDAKGTDIAPNLVERVRNMTQRQFATKVLTSYRIALAPGTAAEEDPALVRDALIEEAMRRDRQLRGQIVMPAWDSSPTVNPHVLDLYAYLSARADGKLGPGRPKLIGGKR